MHMLDGFLMHRAGWTTLHAVQYGHAHGGEMTDN